LWLVHRYSVSSSDFWRFSILALLPVAADFDYRRALNSLPTVGRDLPLHQHTSLTHSHTLPLYTGVGTYFLDSTMSNLRSIRNSDAASRMDRSQQMLLPKTNLHPSNSSKQYVCYACSRSFQRRSASVPGHLSQPNLPRTAFVPGSAWVSMGSQNGTQPGLELPSQDTFPSPTCLGQLS
jgi:hypothetical protein